MRLTLRTMLAYLDDILEPKDAQGLEQKIEESKFASDLVHRIRSSMRRLRLGAPRVDGKGMADDANTVAEYLDNSPTMTPEKVLEFEKVCLESDVHLAEVASAHQILTHVLREPAVFEPAIRERVYRLGHGDATAPVAAHAESKSEPIAREPVDAKPVAAVRSAPMSEERAALANVPAALARQQKPSIPIASLAMTLLLGFVLAVVALRAMGELNSNHPVLRLLVGSPADTQVVQSTESPNTSAANLQSEPPTTETPVTEPDQQGKAAKPDKTNEPSTELNPPEVEKTTRPADAPKETVPVEPATVSADSTRTATATTESATTTPSVPKPEATPAVADVPAKPATETTTSVVPANPTKPTRPAETPPAAPVNTGVYLSEEQVIAYWDASAMAWLLLPTNSQLLAGAELLSLPTYRPQVLVTPNVKVTLVGEAYMTMHVPDAMNLPHITIDTGRATLIPVGEMGGSIRIDVGGRSGILTFDDIESAAAIFVRLYLPQGADPLVNAPNLVVQLWASSGTIQWTEQGKPAIQVTAGQMAYFLNEAEMKVNDKATIPDWVDGKDLSDIDRRASIELRKFLTPERPLSLSLMELTNYRQVEVRSLACRTLCHLDIFEPALESFGDQQHKSYWYAHYDALQTRMSQGAEPAAKLKATVDKLFNDQGDLVFRLLHGYSAEQLMTGGAKELVDELTNPSMAIRALAQENLRRITGKTQLFRPEERPDQEKPKVLKWRKLLEEGEIKYKEPAAQ